MITIELTQGSEAWHQHRSSHLNASEAPVMLGEFPNVTRTELLKVRATGIESEISWFLQKIFDDGHRFEALARPMAEKIVGDDLYPTVGTSGKFSASFDGLTLLEDVVFEHKMLNAILREVMQPDCTGADLPLYHQIQMEQQLMVSGAGRALFMASEWDENDQLVEERHCWYYPNPELRARIVAGWEQFEADVCAYDPVAVAEPVVGRAPDQLPALRIELQGMVTSSNLAEFRSHALAVLGSINRDLQTDADFANAEQTVKWAKAAEERLDAAKSHALSQTADIEAVFRTIDDVKAETRRVRLELDKLVSKRKEERRIEIVQTGREALQAHYDQLNATLGVHAIQFPASLVVADLGQAIKGKKSLASMQDAVSSTVANAKIAASQQADRVRANVAILAEHPDHASLFADRVQLCASKAPEDLRNLAATRIAEHQQREAARLEQERERIRQEEAARLEREQRQRDEDKRRAELAEEDRIRRELEQAEQTVPAPAADLGNVAPQVADAPTGAGAASAGTVRSAGTGGAARIKLSDINAAIAPLSITGDGLAQLGFLPVATERAAKLYDASQFMDMCSALIERLHNAGVDSYRKAA
jgi:predicted phage-related endonuclease